MGAHPRIAVLGMAIESSAYAQHRADYRDFPVLAGPAVLDRYPFLAPGAPLRERADWIGVFQTKSIPGGQVRTEVYQDFREQMVRGLAAVVDDGGVDGVYLDVHGAMSVVGMTDAEGDLVRALREVVGPEVLIAAPMDLHGNVSEVLVRELDLPTCYRMAPHEDAWQTRERSARDLVTWLERAEKPVRAWVPVPILLAGEQTSTRVEPARSLYARIPEITRQPGVTDAALWVGYAWADEPRCHATVMVTGEVPDAVADQAETLAAELWRVREEFDFVADTGSLDEAIDAGLAHRAAGGARPYLVSDSGDNPGAGGSGDVTWTLTRLLQRTDLTGSQAPVTYVASVFDAVAIDELFACDLGDQVTMTVGARVDDRVSPPVSVTGTLLSRHEGDPAAGRIAVLGVGGLRVIVTEFRKAFHAVQDFTQIGLDPAAADLVVTKIGYLEPTLYEIAQGWTLALTPGPVDQDLARLGHQRIQRPMFPFDPFPEPPSLTATVLQGRTVLSGYGVSAGAGA